MVQVKGQIITKSNPSQEVAHIGVDLCSSFVILRHQPRAEMESKF